MTRVGGPAALRCLIPARGGSKRLPGKNLAPLAGKPMLAYTIEAARESGLFPDVVVSTDDGTIAAAARRHGAEVAQRPAALAADSVGVAAVAREHVERLRRDGVPCDVLCLLLPTCPLRTGTDIRAAWEAFEGSPLPILHSVTEYEHPPRRALTLDGDRLRPLASLADLSRQSQELPPAYRITGALTFVRAAHLLATGSYFAEEMLGFRLPRERSVDVDEPYDLAVVEFWLAQRAGPRAFAALPTGT